MHLNVTNNAMISPRDSNFVLYDGECPVCRNYIAWTRLKEISPEIELLDARTSTELVQELRSGGVEINDTMVLSLDGKLLVGAEAFKLISLLGDPNPGLFSSLFLRMATSDSSKFYYPILVRLRKLLLILLFKPLI